MGNRSDQYEDTRAYRRVKENRRILWQVNEGGTRREGVVRNISLSGMLMETDRMVNPGKRNRVIFDSSIERENDFIPREGRIAWKAEKGIFHKKYLYGIEFIAPDSSAADGGNGLAHWIQQKIKEINLRRRWHALVRMMLLFCVVALMGYSLWMGFRIYQDMRSSTHDLITVSATQADLARQYRQLQQEAVAQLKETRQELVETRRLYQEGQIALQNVSQDLQEAREAMRQTEDLLEQTKVLLADQHKENKQLKEEMARLKDFYTQQLASVRADLNNTIALLQQKNTDLTREMARLKEQMDYYSGEARDMKESKALLRLYRNRMKLVKSRIKHFKRQARQARKDALKQRDRLRSLLGNNGYFIKNGKIVQVDEQKYRKASAVTPSSISPEVSKKKIKVDVTFVE